MTEPSPLQRLAYWIREREYIRQAKEAGKPGPWTNDKILATFRFCNVHREDDRVTVWIRRNWRMPHADDPMLWHAMLIARYLNWPPTLAEMGWPEPWQERWIPAVSALKRRRDRGDKVFTGAYIVSTNGVPMNKLDYVMKLFSLSARTPFTAKTLAAAYEQLTAINGVGSFMAAQIIADVKQEGQLKEANDWWDWCAPGPGSTRGLNRLVGAKLNQPWQHKKFIATLYELRKQLTKLNKKCNDLCLQDLQNCLCEFDKYERVRLGQGRPRALYHPADESSLF